MGKVESNKKQKKDALFNTAFELFTTKGTNKTTISDIADKAGVAKGTFYLYFKDKYDIRNKLVSYKTKELPQNRCLPSASSPPARSGEPGTARPRSSSTCLPCGASVS